MRTGPALALVLVLSAVVACGGGGSGDDDPPVPDAPVTPVPDAPSVPDAPVAVECPDIDHCDWLIPYEQEIVAKLSGETEIAAGTTLPSRASVANRAIVRDYLVAELARWGYTATLHQYGANGANIVAELPATTADVGGIVVVGGHFDSIAISPGAADNATGTALVVAAARYFMEAVPVRTRTIRFVLFDQEEVGLVGSEAYALLLASTDVAVHAVHNFDMVSFDGDGDRALELWSPSASLEAAYRAVASPRGIPIQPVAFEFSDHQSFVEAGFTTVGVCEEFVADDHTPHYHTTNDTYDKINFEFLAMATQVGVTVIADSVADAE
jgi:hypothetical protein